MRQSHSGNPSTTHHSSLTTKDSTTEAETIDLSGDDDVRPTTARHSTALSARPSRESTHPSPSTSQPNGTQPLDPIVDILAQRAHKDPEFKALMQECAGGKAPSHRQRLRNHHVELAKAQLEKDGKFGKRVAESEIAKRPVKIQRLEEPADSASLAGSVDVQRRALVRTALTNSDNEDERDNQSLITGPVSRIVVIPGFVDTVKDVANLESTGRQRQIFQSAVTGVMSDIKPPSFGFSPGYQHTANEALTLLACSDGDFDLLSRTGALACKAREEATFKRLMHVVDAGDAPPMKIIEFGEIVADLIEETGKRNRATKPRDRGAIGGAIDARTAASPSHTQSEAARKVVADKVLRKLRMPNLAYDPIVNAVAKLAEESEVLAGTIKAVARGTATSADI